MSKKIISFYLPQYHPTEENNKWWGNGFTEWTNVSSAKPQYNGHYQPHIPADMGFYDLRVGETKQQQADLAKEYGIEGFCYYHYWFNGKRILNRPLDDILKTKEPNFPFALCWANENWTRAWDGQDREVLMQQNYSTEDNKEHIDFLCSIFSDKRYIKINDKPLLLIYRPDNIPNISEMIKLWRRTAQSKGFTDLYICGAQSGLVQFTDEEIISLGFDAVVDFQPNRDDFPTSKSSKNILQESLRSLLPNTIYQWLKTNVTTYKKIDYKDFVEQKIQKKWSDTFTKYPVVFPSWDNTARRASPTIIENHDASIYKKWLQKSLNNVENYEKHEQIVFVNAWNEWAEGCHLEPDKKHGHIFLEATKEALDESN